MLGKTIAWIHGDNLNPNQLALTMESGNPALFVWDDTLVRDWNISFKRIVFMYECLLELPVTIRRGDVAEEVVKFALEHGANRILTAASPSPRHAQICRAIVDKMPEGSQLQVLKNEPFVDYDNTRLDLKRFSRYWRTVKKGAMKPTTR